MWRLLSSVETFIRCGDCIQFGDFYPVRTRLSASGVCWFWTCSLIAICVERRASYQFGCKDLYQTIFESIFLCCLITHKSRFSSIHAILLRVIIRYKTNVSWHKCSPDNVLRMLRIWDSDFHPQAFFILLSFILFQGFLGAGSST